MIGFLQTLKDTESRLEKCKTDFKDDLLVSLSDFNGSVVALKDEFLKNGPFDAEMKSEDAKKIIAEYRQKVSASRGLEAQMKPGLEIFGIEPPVNKETAAVEKDLELLQQVQ